MLEYCKLRARITENLEGFYLACIGNSYDCIAPGDICLDFRNSRQSIERSPATILCNPVSRVPVADTPPIHRARNDR